MNTKSQTKTIVMQQTTQNAPTLNSQTEQILNVATAQQCTNRTRRVAEQKSDNRKIRKSQIYKPSILCLQPALVKYELVWAHIRGYANWPGIIEKETPKGKYQIHFFGDYSRADVSRAKIMHLMEGFAKFSTMAKPTALLLKPIKEAQYSVFDQNRTSCPICDMLLEKRSSTKNNH